MTTFTARRILTLGCEDSVSYISLCSIIAFMSNALEIPEKCITPDWPHAMKHRNKGLIH